MKFLGEVKESNLDNIIDSTQKAVASSGSFKLKLVGIGTFPENNNPKVVWVGTDKGGDGLCKLAIALEARLSSAGYRREERKFRPHLTIGRVKDNKEVNKLINQISKIKNQKFGEVIINNIYIMKSSLTPKGPVYEKLKEVKL